MHVQRHLRGSIGQQFKVVKNKCNNQITGIRRGKIIQIAGSCIALINVGVDDLNYSMAAIYVNYMYINMYHIHIY